MLCQLSYIPVKWSALEESNLFNTRLQLVAVPAGSARENWWVHPESNRLHKLKRLVLIQYSSGPIGHLRLT
jgi:hypothetical protein